MNENDDKPIRLNVAVSQTTRRELQLVADALHISAADTVRLAVSRLIAQQQQVRGIAA